MDRRLAWLVPFLLGAVAAHVLGPPPTVIAAAPTDFADVIARAEPAVVHVTTVLDDGGARGSRDDAVGAGFVLREDGVIVTSRHVLQGARTIRVSIAGRGVLEARVLGEDEATDLVLLRVPARGLPTLPLGDPSGLRPGAWVLAGGSPFHLPRSWSVGIVSGLHRSQLGIHPRAYEDYIQTDAAANLGNSGGPLLDAQGRVVGMMTAILSRTGRSQGISLAVPIDAVAAAARRLLGEGPTDRPGLGLVLREMDVRGSGSIGLLVTRFRPGSPAVAAGVRVGDVLVAADGQPLRQVADLQRALWRGTDAAPLVLELLRDGRRLRVAVPRR